MAMNKQRRTANLNNIVTYDTLKNVTLLADLTVEGLTGAGFVKADANGLLSVDTGAYLPIPSQTGNGGKYLTTDGVNLSWGTVSTANIYTDNGTLAGNRVVTLDDKQLVFRSNASTLQNYTFTVGTPTGIAPSTWPASVVFEGEYLMSTANAEPYNTRVWVRNQTASTRTSWVNQVFADVTSESTGSTNIHNQYYITRRGSQLDTGLVSLMAGLSTITGHGYSTSQSTTTDITTTTVYGYQSNLNNYGGNITNAYSILARTQVSNSYVANNTRNSTITNLYNLYIDNNIGGNFATATVTSLYAIYIATNLGPSGTISNRWGIYAPDVAMDHYFNGNVLIGTASDTGSYKLDVAGAISIKMPSYNSTGFQLLNADGVADWKIINAGSTTTDRPFIQVPRWTTGTPIIISNSNRNQGAVNDAIMIGGGVPNNGDVLANKSIRIGKNSNNLIGIGSIVIGTGNAQGDYSISISSEQYGIPVGNVPNNNSFYIGSAIMGATTANNQGILGVTDVFIGRPARAISFTGDPGAGTATSINGMGGTGLTDATGGNLTIAGGIGLGAGTPGDVIISTATPTSTGTTLQTLTQRVWIKGDNGNVGIGATPNASYKLDINGTARVSSSLDIGNNSDQSTYIAFRSPSSKLSWWGSMGAAGQFINNSAIGDLFIRPNAPSSTQYFFKSIGNLGEAGYRYQFTTGQAIYKDNGTTFTSYASSIFALDSVSRGFLPPRMTTTQKNAIATPAAGLMVFDNTLNKSSYYNGTTWVDGGDNIYNSNGTLTGNRTVTMGSFTLSFDKDISVNALTIGKGGGSIGTNTSIGINAIMSNTTGNNNTSIGYDSGKTNTTGVNNTYVGFSSGASNQNSRNTAVGYYAGGDNTSGTYNTALGHNALKPNTSGSYNIGIGGESGQGNTTGSYNIFIGLLTTALADNQTNQIVIGNQITGLGSNTTIIGTASTITTALRGRLLLGTTTDTGLYQLDVQGTSNFSNKLSVIATTTTNDVALFRSVEPYVTIEAVGASNPASIFFRPSTSAQNATIQNRTGGGIDLYTGGTPSLSLAVKSSGAVVASSTLGLNGVEDSVKSNTYTPTLTNVSNITSSSVSANAFRYIRIGNIVYVSGRVTVNATAANTATEIEISLPIASNLTNSIDLSGVATTPSNGYGQVIGDTASDTGSFYVFPTSAGSAPWNVEFSYVII